MELTLKCLAVGFGKLNISAGRNAAPDAKKVNVYISSPQEYQQLENENDKLKRILGEKDLEIEILRGLPGKALLTDIAS